MYLYGASGHGKVIKDILEANGQRVDAFVDDNQSINEMCGKVCVGEGTLVGASSLVIPCIEIDYWSVIGAIAAFVENIGDGVTTVGNPAKPVRGGDYPLVTHYLYIGGWLYAA